MKTYLLIVFALFLMLYATPASAQGAPPTSYGLYIVNSASITTRNQTFSATCGQTPIASPTMPLPAPPTKVYWVDPMDNTKQCFAVPLPLNTLSPDTYTVLITAILGTFETTKAPAGSFIQPNPSPPAGGFIK